MLKITLFLVISVSCFAQISDSESLINVHNVSDLSAMNNIANPEQGNLVFVESTNTLYFYDSNNWVSISTSGSGDGDAWGVNGEDISSEITRTGKVIIGPSATDETLDVLGSARFQTLNTGDNNRGLVHSSDGTIRSDQFTRYYNGVPSSSWQFLNFVSNGAIITCYWFSNQSSCSSGGIFAGHIQFRYQRSTNWYYPHYTVGSVVNWNINFSDGLVYSISNGASGSCPWVGFYFRVAGNQLQIRNPLGFSPNVHLKVEAY